MDQQEFLRFLQEIIKNSGERGMENALVQFANILERNNFGPEFIQEVMDLSNLSKEAFELKKQCMNADLTRVELQDAIKRGKLRKKREEEERRGRC